MKMSNSMLGIVREITDKEDKVHESMEGRG